MSAHLANVPSDALTARLYELRRQERTLLVEFLFYLGEVERRRLHLELGYASMFVFLTRYLGYSNSSAFRRSTAARLLASFPAVAEYLADGRLCLTTLVDLRTVLDEDHLTQVLDRAAGRTEEEVKRLVAAMRPRPAVPDLVRRLPRRRVASTPAELAGVVAASAPAELAGVAAPSAPVQPSHAEMTSTASAPVEPSHAEATAAPVITASITMPSGRGSVRPLSATEYALRATVGEEFVRDLEAVRAALSHKLPGGSLEAVLHECLRVTLAACEKRRRGTGKATAPPANDNDNDGRYVPAALRDQVWCRDAGRCTFVGAHGHVCGSTYQIELHHIVPFARGGAATLANLTLRCRMHNLHEAERDFGAEHMRDAIQRARTDPHQASLF